MSTDNTFQPKFRRGERIFKRNADGFFHGTVLGYVQDENDNWCCVVYTTLGTYLLVQQDTLEYPKSAPEFKSSK